MPPSKSKYNPFFSRSMGQLPIVQAFFSQHLPEHIRPLVDLDSLVRLDRTNTNAKLAQCHRDIAYEAPMEGKHRILACAEHQSEPDRMMLVRLLHYSAGDLYAYLKEHQKILLLINVLFYHGQQAPYPHPNTLQAYYENPEWGSQELSLRFHAVDSTQISDKEALEGVGGEKQGPNALQAGAACERTVYYARLLCPQTRGAKPIKA